jgi:Flp pilus assembly pilin Flp
MIARLIKDEYGQAATEYALIASALMIGLFVAAKVLMGLQGQVYNNQHQALKEWRAP